MDRHKVQAIGNKSAPAAVASLFTQPADSAVKLLKMATCSYGFP